MKLLARYNRINLVVTVIILFITGGVYYGAISYILNNQVDKEISIEEQEVISYLSKYGKLPPEVDYKDQKVSYYNTAYPQKRRFTDTTFYNKKEGEYEAGRALVTSANVNGVNHKIVIAESKVETEDLIRLIFYITIALILFLLLILFITNRFILNRIWQPFYHILQQLKTFRLTDQNEITGSVTKIDEFTELNDAVTAMASRVKNDYRDLKTFTENASHELLTPIAVINSKLDSLIQAGDYDEPQSKLLTDVYDAVSRLTRLNQSLLLLVKIENRLVTDEQDVDLKLLIEEKLVQFKELFNDKDIKITTALQDKQINVSKYLIDILLNNLLSNAIRHNHTGGVIDIVLTNHHLAIKNTGADTALVPADIYKRFNKAKNSEGTGLGLTLSKQICDNYKFSLEYGYTQSYHSFTISFVN
ncbi:HAMP domain-containing histidine kinase [Mucilaginibacter sp. HMF5004]|uniref:sensor histidine kinase n=1 Tax=Mucilaginibacter rivuli TaxID=2857527 RepID=UPI001C5D2A12|nr:HAMP domain-containing sensor histidine kinase [Mucilaginibacter rivuli]MBW4889679.1 HAMP domain-containing histidine kinase [Mucilaginibacter rivuli]